MAAEPPAPSLHIVVCVEGAIGVGKSTLCRAMHELLPSRCSVVPECVPLALQQLYYAEPRRYAFALQLYAASQRAHTLAALLRASPRRRSGTHYTFVDRSVVGDWAFASCNRTHKNLDEREWCVYKDVIGCTPEDALERALRTMHLQTRLVVLYLHDDADRCIARARARSDTEKGASAEYMRDVQREHEWCVQNVSLCTYAEEPHAAGVVALPDCAVLTLHFDEYASVRHSLADAETLLTMLADRV